MTNPNQFAIIYPYQFDDDLALGVWQPEVGGWLFGDGDFYKPDSLFLVWGDAATLLTWSEVEKRLKAAEKPCTAEVEK